MCRSAASGRQGQRVPAGHAPGSSSGPQSPPCTQVAHVVTQMVQHRRLHASAWHISLTVPNYKIKFPKRMRFSLYALPATALPHQARLLFRGALVGAGEVEAEAAGSCGDEE